MPPLLLTLWHRWSGDWLERSLPTTDDWPFAVDAALDSGWCWWLHTVTLSSTTQEKLFRAFCCRDIGPPWRVCVLCGCNISLKSSSLTRQPDGSTCWHGFSFPSLLIGPEGWARQAAKQRQCVIVGSTLPDPLPVRIRCLAQPWHALPVGAGHIVLFRVILPPTGSKGTAFEKETFMAVAREQGRYILLPLLMWKRGYNPSVLEWLSLPYACPKSGLPPWTAAAAARLSKVWWVNRPPDCLAPCNTQTGSQTDKP